MKKPFRNSVIETGTKRKMEEEGILPPKGSEILLRLNKRGLSQNRELKQQTVAKEKDMARNRNEKMERQEHDETKIGSEKIRGTGE